MGVEPPTGCPYYPRCPLAEDVCRSTRPELIELAVHHAVACHVAERRARAADAVPVPEHDPHEGA
jgi:ABC-type antimicrobial peptide transport system ATPase subunit